MPRGVSGTIDPAGSIAYGGRRSHQPRRKDVLESIQSMSLLTIMEIVGPVLLLAVSDLRYAAVVAPKARANTGSPGSHPRASSIGRAPRRKSGKKQARRRRGKTTPAGPRACDRSAVANTKAFPIRFSASAPYKRHVDRAYA